MELKDRILFHKWYVLPCSSLLTSDRRRSDRDKVFLKDGVLAVKRIKIWNP